MFWPGISELDVSSTSMLFIQADRYKYCTSIAKKCFKSGHDLDVFAFCWIWIVQEDRLSRFDLILLGDDVSRSES